MQIRSIGQIVLDIKRAYDWYADLGISPVGPAYKKSMIM
jgi:hypothetical protein